MNIEQKIHEASRQRMLAIARRNALLLNVAGLATWSAGAVLYMVVDWPYAFLPSGVGIILMLHGWKRGGWVDGYEAASGPLAEPARVDLPAGHTADGRAYWYAP